MSVTREQLEKVRGWLAARTAIAVQTPYLSPTDAMTLQYAVDVAIEHLPVKTIWIVEGIAGNSAPYNRVCEADTLELAHSYVDCLLSDGFGLISIKTKEVTA